MKLLGRLLAWLWRPSPATEAALCAEIDAALDRRRERRAAYQARARKGAATRIHNRFTGDRLTGATTEERTN